MADFTVKKIDEMEAIYGGGFKRARAELGVESFGMQVIDLPPNFERYPTHDHAGDGQEEVFVALGGGGQIKIEDELHPLDSEHMVRVASGVSRKVLPGEEGIRLLVLGGVPNKVYDPPEVSNLGGLDPALQS